MIRCAVVIVILILASLFLEHSVVSNVPQVQVAYHIAKTSKDQMASNEQNFRESRIST